MLHESCRMHKSRVVQAFKAVKEDKLYIRENAYKFNIPYRILQKHLLKDSTELVTMIGNYDIIQ